MKDRELLFNDYLNDLRKQEKEDKYAEKEKLKKNYISMLKEIKTLHRHSSWTETKKQLESDPRYKAIESSSRREDYFRDYCKYLDEKPKDKDREHRSDKKDKDKNREAKQDEHQNGNTKSSKDDEDREEGEESETDEKEEKRGTTNANTQETQGKHAKTAVTTTLES